MKKKKYLIIVMSICLFILVIFMLNNKQIKINKGIQEFGTDYCQGHNSSGLLPAGSALTPWVCEICGYEEINSNTNVPEICGKCAEITGRCQKCGKIKANTND